MTTGIASNAGGYTGASPRSTAAVLSGSRTALHDPRWPLVAAALATLRDGHRCSVRIVDADCGAGSLLLQLVRHARALGFTAIEGRGIDGSPALIGRARAAAARLSDPAIGVEFELADMVSALREEFDLPADIVIWHGGRDEDWPEAHRSADIRDVLSRAGTLVIGDDGAATVEGSDA